MDGRGVNSGSSAGNKVVGYAVTINGETTNYYFAKINGQNYYQCGVGGIPELTPLNMPPDEFRNRAASNGATVKNISATEKRKEEIRRKADREKANKELDIDWYRAAPKKRKGWKGH